MRFLSRFNNRRLSAAYRRVFGAPSADAVLADLGDFCRAREAPFVAGDAVATGILISRQEVFHRIARYLNLAAMTANETDDKVVNHILKAINLIGFNFGTAKNDPTVGVTQRSAEQ